MAEEAIAANDLADAMIVEPESDEEQQDDQDVKEAKDEKEPDPEETEGSEEKAADQDADDIKTLRADLKKELKELKKTASSEKEELKREINRLGYVKRENEKLKKQIKAEKKEDVFTDAQLLQMMEDHQDEPDVLFQVIKQMSKQSGDEAAKTAESKATVKAKRKELTSLAEKTFPGSLDAGSPFYDDVQKNIAHYGLDDHPYGDVLSLGLMTMQYLPNFYRNVQEATKKEILGKKADTKRKDKIGSEKLAEKGSRKASKRLPPDTDETVQRLGLKTKRQKELYKKFLGAGKKAAAVQASI